MPSHIGRHIDFLRQQIAADSAGSIPNDAPLKNLVLSNYERAFDRGVHNVDAIFGDLVTTMMASYIDRPGYSEAWKALQDYECRQPLR